MKSLIGLQIASHFTFSHLSCLKQTHTKVTQCRAKAKKLLFQSLSMMKKGFSILFFFFLQIHIQSNTFILVVYIGFYLFIIVISQYLLNLPSTLLLIVSIFPSKNNLDEKQKIIHIIKSNMYKQKIIRVICNIQQ